MKRSELEALELSAEQIDKIMALHGADIETHKAATAAANKTIADLQAAVKQYDGVDVEKLRGDLAALEQKYQDDMTGMRLNHAVDLALSAAKARNPKVAKAALDLSKLTLDGDAVKGLDEQLAALRESDAYLFADAQPKIIGAPPVKKTAPEGGARRYTHEQIAAMSPEDINRNWPEISKSLDQK